MLLVEYVIDKRKWCVYIFVLSKYWGNESFYYYKIYFGMYIYFFVFLRRVCKDFKKCCIMF